MYLCIRIYLTKYFTKMSRTPDELSAWRYPKSPSWLSTCFPAAVRRSWRAVQLLSKANLDCSWLSKLASQRNLASNLPSKPASKRNLAPLGSILGALATLKIKLSPTRELDFNVFAVLPLKTAFWAQLASSWPPLGAPWASLELNLEPLRRVLDPTWRLLG